MSKPDKSIKKLSKIFKELSKMLERHLVSDQMVCTSRPLTKDEQTLVRQIFGPDLDTSPIMNHHNPEDSPYASAIVRNGNDIIYYDRNWSEEFTKDGPFKFGNFVHEVTHVWQHQTNFQGDPGHGDYKIVVSPDKKFSDYHSEHQGALMEDYARRFLHPLHQMRRIPATPENDTLLKQIVEDQFPGAKTLRLALEAVEQKALQKAPPTGPKA